MVKRVDALTPEQRASMPEWAERWVTIGLQTGETDWKTFEQGARAAYRFAGLAEPKCIVHVQSPFIGALAFPIADYLLMRAGNRGDAVDGAVDGAVHGAVDDAVGGAVNGAVAGAVRGAVGDAVGDAVRGAVDDAVNGAVNGAVGDAVGDAVRGAVRDAVDDAVAGAVDGAVHGAVRDAVHGAVRDAVDDAVAGAVRGAVGDAVRGAVGGAVGDAVRGAVRDAVDDAVADAAAIQKHVRNNWYRVIGGQFWVGWGWGWWSGSPAVVSYYREVCGLELPGDIPDRALAYEQTARSACWWWPHRDFVIVCARPIEIHRDEAGRLHSADGPAISWPDGFAIWAWHGVRVPQFVVERPHELTAQRVLAERNAEVSRVMRIRMGEERFVHEAAFEVVDEDQDTRGGLRRLLRIQAANHPDRVMQWVDVRCPSTAHDYLLRVPPNMRTCKQAVAWTVGLEEKEFAPLMET